jgi:AAA15 family ATPase/GTPase
LIEKIVIKNFQSHNRTVLKLHEGINGIIGRPNSGKTAIIRAILLLKNNRPSGFAYHNKLVTSLKTEVHIKPNNSPLCASES